MAAEIEIAGEFGGPSIDPVKHVRWKVLKPAAKPIVLQSLDPRVKQLSLLLRVSGPVKQYEGNPVEEVKFGRSREWISVDLLVWQRDWQDRTYRQIADVLCDRVRAVPSVVAVACRAKKVSIDEEMLGREMEEYIQNIHNHVAIL